MVDLNIPEEKEKDNEKNDKDGGGKGKTPLPGGGGVGESSKLKRFMGKTPGILKTKLLTVLGNSNEIINGISNKLTLSSSSSDDCCDEDEEVPVYDETIDYTKIDFESRRMKSRRAHEEVISGRYRHPNLLPKCRQKNLELDNKLPQQGNLSSSNTSSKISSLEEGEENADSKMTTLKAEEDQVQEDNMAAESNKRITELGDDLNRSELNGLVSISPTIGANATENRDEQNNSENVLELTLCNQQKKPISNSSTLTSLNDPPGAGCVITPSIDSSDFKNFMRSDSMNSVPSWASSISLDCKSEESVKEFMKKFVEILFENNSPAIDLGLKSEFGDLARCENGRLWFSRFARLHKKKSKRVGESTFFSLIQYFATILFECLECEDYYPAKHLMNMCFTYYREIEVPGCDPYREYLFTYLRQQPIWHTIRFWNAAFFDALQHQRATHSVPIISTKNKKISLNKKEGEKDDSSSDSSHQEADDLDAALNAEIQQISQQTLVFKLLGNFTCNMHAFGMNRDLCLDFLRKQSKGNLTKEQEKILRENVIRMYHETDLWGAKEA